MYAVIDVETTGLNASHDRITEIAIYIHDGEKVVDRFESLVNPECHIPHHITALTGISNKLVLDAPKFYEIARKVVEITEGTTIVAHNASFDYNFIRSEFRRLYYDFRRKTLCTKKLSRKLIPGLLSYGLGNLCRHLEIPNPARHRAGGDAIATTRLLEKLLRLENNLEGLPLKGLQTNIPREELEALPDTPGVYYFMDENLEILYIGKSVNLKSRVLSHISNNTDKKEIDLRDRSFHISFETTGSDLIASLLESDEIKKHKPLFNRTLRRTSFPCGLFSYTGKDGYIRLTVETIKGDQMPLTAYSSKKEARSHLAYLMEKFRLCAKYCSLFNGEGNCFEYHLGMCDGACSGEVSPAEYNDRVIDLISYYSYHNKNFFIIDDGRHEEEVSAVKVENGRYVGYGYLDVSAIGTDSGILHDSIHPFQDSRDAQVILRGFLRRNNFEKLIIY
jgi:DNA polymerase III subunit epsilon